MATIRKSSTDVRGKTVRLKWTEGPTKGKIHEHVFHDDGTVEWHAVENGGKNAEGKTASAQSERPQYQAYSLDKQNTLVSYLSQSGFTLTFDLRFSDDAVMGFASNDKTWVPVRGTFEVVD